MRNRIRYSLLGCAIALILAFYLTQSTKAVIVFSTEIPTLTVVPSSIPARDLDLLPTFEDVASVEYDDCTLPCWWGFTTGETTITEIMTFLQETGFDRHWRESRYSSVTLEEYLRFNEVFILKFEGTWPGISNFWIDFLFDEDVLKQMTVQFVNPRVWLSSEADHVGLPQILSQIEEIPTIYTGANPRLSLYPIVLVYPERNVEIFYHFDLTNDHSPRSVVQRLCLDIERTEDISMRLNWGSLEDFPSLNDVYDSPEEAYNLSTETLVEFFRENPDDCLDVSEYQNQ
jgi:hypothetical protein